MILYFKPKPKKSWDDYIIERAKEKERKKQAIVKDKLAINIGEQFRQIRLSKHLTQQQFAQLLNTPQSSVSRLENGDFLPKLSVLKRFATKLNLDLTISLTDHNHKK